MHKNELTLIVAYINNNIVKLLVTTTFFENIKIGKPTFYYMNLYGMSFDYVIIIWNNLSILFETLDCILLLNLQCQDMSLY